MGRAPGGRADQPTEMMIECPVIMDYDDAPSRVIIIKLPGFVGVGFKRTVNRDHIPG